MEPGPVQRQGIRIEVRADSCRCIIAAVGQCDIHLRGYSDALYAEAAIHVSLLSVVIFISFLLPSTVMPPIPLGPARALLAAILYGCVFTVHQNEVCCR